MSCAALHTKMHYSISGPTVVSFSGGRTSAYRLRQVLDNNDLTDLVVTFANTD